MRPELLQLLRSPCCETPLSLIAEVVDGDGFQSGSLTCDRCAKSYPITNSIPRFVPAENYADNFGWQWNQFRRTQLDSHSGHPITRNRFFTQSGWTADELRDKWVLDVGCGAGRFAEIAVSCGAKVVAIDYSSAVDACYENLNGRGSIHVVQGDIYQLPFALEQFDYVYCFGVLQHTPDVKRSLEMLPRQLRDGGKLAVDVYAKSRLNVIWPKYWLRTITRRMPSSTLFKATTVAVPMLLPLSSLVGRVPVVGRKLRYAVPVVNYERVLPLTPLQVREWAILDTFDMFSARYDQPQSAATIESWLREFGLSDVKAFRKGQVVGQGVRRVTTGPSDARNASSGHEESRSRRSA